MDGFDERAPPPLRRAFLFWLVFHPVNTFRNRYMQTTQEISGTTPQAQIAVNPLERRLDVTVPLDVIEQDVEKRLKHLSRTAKMPGFRPGKVPMKLVTQQYGYQARSEAIGAAVEKTFGEVVREQKLRVAGYPNFEPKAGVDADQMGFSAIFEVYPEIKLGDVADREIEKSTLAVGDAEVDKTLEVLRKQRTTFAEVQRAAADGDRLVIDFIGRRDGEPFQGGQASDFMMLVGGGQMLPDFEKAVLGMSAGETKTFDLTFPEEYQAKDLSGQTVQFELTVKRVDGPELPPLHADFAKSLGIEEGDLSKMRAEIKENLEREVGRRLKARIKTQALDALVAANPIDVPQTLVQAESGQMAQAAVRDLESRGMSAQNIPVQPSWFTEQAVRRVKLGLIVAELVKDKQLFAKPEQVRAVIEEFAETYEDPSEVVRWYYSQPQRMAEAESLVLENNVVDWVLGNAKVSEKPVSFEELMETQS
jgi:trigger factor